MDSVNFMKERIFVYGQLPTGDWDEMDSFESWADAGADVDARRAGTKFAAEGVTTPDLQNFYIGTAVPKS